MIKYLAVATVMFLGLGGASLGAKFAVAQYLATLNLPL